MVKVEKVILEMERLRERRYKITPENMMIDGAATFAWDAHGRRDGLEEVARGKGKIGTTKQGVGPAAADYTARQDLRYWDLLLPQDKFDAAVKWEIERQNTLLHTWGDTEGIDPDEAYRHFLEWRNILSPYIQNTYPIVMKAFNRNGNVVLEGAQGFRISLDTGYRNRVTSTDSGPGPFERRYRTSRDRIGHRLGVLKLASTVVGSHLIQSPIDPRLADILYARTEARGSPEAGRVSGRKRQYYWLSIPEVRAAIDTYGLDGLLIAKMDVLDELPEIHLGTEYKFPDGETTTDFDPDDPRMLDERTRMNTLRMPGWNGSTAGMRSFADAPQNFRAVVQTVEELTGVPIYGVGTGPNFGEAIHAENSPFQVVEI